jgi:hypothetical protein
MNRTCNEPRKNKAKLGQDGTSGGRRAREGAIVQNEANSPAAPGGRGPQGWGTRGNCAKQDAPDKSLVQPTRPAISARKRGSKPSSATFVVGVKQTQCPDCGFWIADSGQTCGGTPPGARCGPIVRQRLVARCRSGSKANSRRDGGDEACGARGCCANKPNSCVMPIRRSAFPGG